MKKKNQELEKFKFVLDYKIKELRRQMEPRENEIKRMKEQIRKVNTSTQDCRSSSSSFVPSPFHCLVITITCRWC